MRDLVKKMLPAFVGNIYMTLQTYIYDCKRLFRFAFGYNNNVENVKANLILVLHGIEKGLTMPNPKPGFGIIKLGQILNLIGKLKEKDSGCFEIKYTKGIILQYIKFHEDRNLIIPIENKLLLEKLEKELSDIDISSSFSAQQLHFTEELFFSYGDSFLGFIEGRHSLRNYDSKPINKDIFLDVAKYANFAPSSCNRQSCRSYSS